ncbi:cytochrome B5 [Pelotomaculum isophthalicicum JI]|uniref:Cytochrome B5 n=1 Tax=Pelotomaculum isophthalicicum JI TaxID=947010 RepID=A0A9X4H3B3_9FIRM|nr:cytochrome b5 domain-containing protein [Pelotomaculum isophthalicicum]MDF9408986.1 cytochrome B5 [Pelotomaculum isophthalicicum JI]
MAAVERYHKILFGLEYLPYRNMITEIYTDELKHGSKWNYLYAVNCSCCMPQGDTGNHSLQMKFTLEQLAQLNGQNGKPAYVAVNGIVYDVTNTPNWQGGQHFGLQAGKDFTAQFVNCHPNQYAILNILPRVGVLV